VILLLTTIAAGNLSTCQTASDASASKTRFQILIYSYLVVSNNGESQNHDCLDTKTAWWYTYLPLCKNHEVKVIWDDFPFPTEWRVF
jgi:hypothetical protein